MIVFIRPKSAITSTDGSFLINEISQYTMSFPPHPTRPKDSLPSRVSAVSIPRKEKDGGLCILVGRRQTEISMAEQSAKETEGEDGKGIPSVQKCTFPIFLTEYNVGLKMAFNAP